jgi:large subunit ribosomal protein L10
MRKEKQYLLDDLKSKIESAKAFIVTQYDAVSANVMNDFRKDITESGNDFEVVPKRVFIKAAEEASGVKFTKETLQGHIGIVIADEDYISAAKAVRKLGKDSDKMEIIAGYIEGKLYDQASVIKLSELPNLDEMRAQFIGTLEAPMAQTLSTFEALLTSVMHCLENKAKLEQI